MSGMEMGGGGGVGRRGDILIIINKNVWKMLVLYFHLSQAERSSALYGHGFQRQYQAGRTCWPDRKNEMARQEKRDGHTGKARWPDRKSMLARQEEHVG